jgi:hypothetical protein
MKDPASPREDEPEAAMSARSAAGLLAILVLVTGTRPRVARAAGPRCDGLIVQLDAEAEARWPELAVRIRGSFAGREDVDGCARVRLMAQGESAVLTVILPDGRSALRPVARLEDVIPMVEALLLVPAQPSSPVTETIAPGPAMRRPAPTTTADATPPMLSASPTTTPRAVPSGSAPRPLRFELSLLTGGRLGGMQTSVGLGLLAQLCVHGWLFGFEARADRYQYRDRDAPLPALELVVLGGRRWRLGSASLDLAAGLAAVDQGTTTIEMPASNGQVMSYSSHSTVPRVRLGLRLGFRADASLRPFVGLEGEFGPARPPDGPFGDVPYLPRATVGLTVGATVGTP